MALLGEAWNPEAEFILPAASAETTESRGCALFLLQGSDRPVAVILAPTEEADGEARRSLVELMRKLLLLVDPLALRSFSAPAAAAETEKIEFARFVSPNPPSWEVLLEPATAAALEAFIQARSPKEAAREMHKALAAPPADPGHSPTSLSLSLSGSVAARGSAFFFPTAFSSGGTSIRFRPRSITSGPVAPEFAPSTAGFSWHQYGVKVGGTSFNGYWAFKGPESLDAARLNALGASLAKAAAAAFPAEFSRYGIAESVPAISKPVAPPKLGNTAVFVMEGSVAVGGSILETRIIVPLAYPKNLAAAAGVAAADPLDAFMLLSRTLPARDKGNFLDALATEYRSDPVPGARAPNGILFIPFFEFLAILSDIDYRRVVQGFFPRHYQKTELAKLLFHRKTVPGPDGAPKRVVVRPAGMDFNRLLATLPRGLGERFPEQVRTGISSPAVDDFLKRNEDAYEAALADYRRGALELYRSAAESLQYLYTRYVYAVKRKRLDDMITKDYPLSLLKTIPPSAFRRTIDLTDFKAIAASYLGRETGIGEISRWCSKHKMENIQVEMNRVNGLLEQGAIDPDELCTLRSELAKKAAETVKREREERQKEFSRSIVEPEPPRTGTGGRKEKKK